MEEEMVYQDSDGEVGDTKRNQRKLAKQQTFDNVLNEYMKMKGQLEEHIETTEEKCNKASDTKDAVIWGGGGDTAQQEGAESCLQPWSRSEWLAVYEQLCSNRADRWRAAVSSLLHWSATSALVPLVVEATLPVTQARIAIQQQREPIQDQLVFGTACSSLLEHQLNEAILGFVNLLVKPMERDHGLEGNSISQTKLAAAAGIRPSLMKMRNLLVHSMGPAKENLSNTKFTTVEWMWRFLKEKYWDRELLLQREYGALQRLGGPHSEAEEWPTQLPNFSSAELLERIASDGEVLSTEVLDQSYKCRETEGEDYAAREAASERGLSLYCEEDETPYALLHSTSEYLFGALLMKQELDHPSLAAPHASTQAQGNVTNSDSKATQGHLRLSAKKKARKRKLSFTASHGGHSDADGGATETANVGAHECANNAEDVGQKSKSAVGKRKYISSAERTKAKTKRRKVVMQVK